MLRCCSAILPCPTLDFSDCALSTAGILWPSAMMVASQEKTRQLAKGGDLPPTPPESDDNTSPRSSSPAICKQKEYHSLPQLPSRPAVDVLDVDKKTPDSHVPRDARLIRLTGVHPFNVEAPLSDLFNEGFLTSPELFYVRNHGAVPQVHDDEVLNWEFSVEG